MIGRPTMSSNPDPDLSSIARPHWRWACLTLALALAWVALARQPLVLNAKAHLDSDLAVDGLTLIDALDGHWRWHYPATPFIGSPPVLLSWVQAKVWGPTPMALVSGGVVAYGLVVVATFLLNRRAFGPSVASWGLVPLTFASTGLIWLSGRVTGGHLLAAAWHAGAFGLLWDALTKGGWRRSATLGLWCGFGLYIDSMLAVTWVGIGAAGLAWAFSSSPLPLGEGVVKKERTGSRRVVRSIACLLAFGLASGVGVAPRVIGKRVAPHDAYVGQFEPVVRADHLGHNAWILLLDCLPRLVAGHRLPGLETEPDPAKLEGGSTSVSPIRYVPWLGLAGAVTVVSLGHFGWAMLTLAFRQTTPDPARSAIRLGLRVSTLAVLVGFLIYPRISNSDHYRYLVFVLTPWSAGFGLMMTRIVSKGRWGPWAAGALTLGFALLMTADSARWYARLGWIDSAGLPVRKRVEEPVLDWLVANPKVSTILGDYWEVYKLSFLTQGRVRAAPFPQYPDRFPEIGRGLPEALHPVVIVRPNRDASFYRRRALEAGGRELLRVPGLSIVEWPKGMAP
jgi:hypothetical protein